MACNNRAAAACSAKTGGAAPTCTLYVLNLKKKLAGHVHEGMKAQSIKARMLNCRLDEGMKVFFTSLACGELIERFCSPEQRGEGHAEVT